MAVITYKCPNCGGPLTWDADKQAYFCDYCNSKFSQEEIAKIRPESAAVQQETQAAAEPDREIKETDHTEEIPRGQVTLHYTCPNCGAEIMTDETTAAAFCYYCHNPVVLSDRLSGDKLPELIAPFEISREKAREIFLEWIKRHRYIPKDFYNEKQITLLSGVYFPYWIYDCEVDGSLSGDGKKLRVWTAGGFQFTETSVYDISRSGSMQIENVTRIALKKASRVLCESVMPFRPEKMRPFAPAYLQGYSAEIRDIDKDALSGEMSEEIRRFAGERLQEEAGDGYNSIDVKQLEATVTKESWHYALMPVWTLTYRDPKKDRLYYFSINGQTGKTCGVLPTDTGRLFRLFLLVFIPAFLILLLMMYFLF